MLGSLARPATLANALGAAGFVQADPIRAPARAQDLILRQRVANYRVGDLDRRFVRLGLEEDFLYAYGFMPRDTARLLHPRDPETSGYYDVPRALAAEVLAFVRDQGPTHPPTWRSVSGASAPSTAGVGSPRPRRGRCSICSDHGQLRVAGRRDGIRIYEAATPHEDPLPPEERARQLVLLVVGILAPLAEAGLASTFGLLGRGAPGLGGWRKTVAAMVASGALESGEVDGERYYWPAGCGGAAQPARCGSPPGAVRSHRMGTAPLPAFLGLGVPVRGLYQAGPAPLRLLRNAAALAR